MKKSYNFDLSYKWLSLVLLSVISSGAFAQTQPDSGQTLQQLEPPLVLPNESNPPQFNIPVISEVRPGGPQVKVNRIQLNGNSVFDDKTLLAALGDYSGKSLDLSGLRNLTDRLTEYYRSNGYIFARAFLPSQTVSDGVIRVEIVEGRWGQVMASGESAFVQQANAYLATLQTGTVIEGDALERTMLIMDDLPGIKIAPIIRPGEEFGTGDLNVGITRSTRLSGDVEYDNHGNRFTGEQRLRFNLQLDSPFLLGDQILLRSLYTNEDLWLGSLTYSLPIGGNGLRGNINYARTYYELGKDFAYLRANGTAEVSSVGLMYPTIRSQNTNLSFSFTLQQKFLDDAQELSATDNRKSINSLQIVLNFDRRDMFGNGGVNYGSLSLTSGRLRLDAELEAADIASGQNTNGYFNKLNLDVARVLATPVEGLSLFGRISSQWTADNLDSSEGFSLGGPNGVRAYPIGEGNGDKGWLAQLELRYIDGDFTSYFFHDTGHVTINADTSKLTVQPVSNYRSISGSGVGLRYQRDKLSLDANVAWRNHGGSPESDEIERHPRLWLSVRYRF